MRAGILKNAWVFVVCAAVAAMSPAVAWGAVDVPVDVAAGSVQNEIELTLIPGDSNILAMAYNDNPYTGSLGIAYSSDRGASWLTTQLSIPFEPTGGIQMAREFDPTITADANGVLFAACIADGAIISPNPLPGGDDSGLYAFRSTDYGKTWGAPYQVAYDGASMVPVGEDPNYRFNDRCRIIADISGTSTYQGNVYITWIKDRGLQDRNILGRIPQGDIYFSRSTDGGTTYSAAMVINDPNNDMGNIPIPAVASDGTIYIAWLDYDVWTVGTGQIYLRKSTDGGATFPAWDANYADHPVAQINLPPIWLTIADGNTDLYTKANSGAPIAASPVDPNILHIAYAADPDGKGADEADVFVITSTDAGQTWGSAVRVNDDSTTTDQAFPWIEVKPDGTIDVVWYDKRSDPNDMYLDVYIAKSTDGGVSFSTNVCLTDTAEPAPGNKWIGEYIGLAVDANTAYVAFTSSVTDPSWGDVYFDLLANSEIPEPTVMALVAAGAVLLLRRRRR